MLERSVQNPKSAISVTAFDGEDSEISIDLFPAVLEGEMYLERLQWPSGEREVRIGFVDPTRPNVTLRMRGTVSDFTTLLEQLATAIRLATPLGFVLPDALLNAEERAAIEAAEVELEKADDDTDD